MSVMALEASASALGPLGAAAVSAGLAASGAGLASQATRKRPATASARVVRIMKCLPKVFGPDFRPRIRSILRRTDGEGKWTLESPPGDGATSLFQALDLFPHLID